MLSLHTPIGQLSFIHPYMYRRGYVSKEKERNCGTARWGVLQDNLVLSTELITLMEVAKRFYQYWDHFEANLHKFQS